MLGSLRSCLITAGAGGGYPCTTLYPSSPGHDQDAIIRMRSTSTIPANYTARWFPNERAELHVNCTCRFVAMTRPGKHLTRQWSRKPRLEAARREHSIHQSHWLQSKGSRAAHGQLPTHVTCFPNIRSDWSDYHRHPDWVVPESLLVTSLNPQVSGL